MGNVKVNGVSLSVDLHLLQKRNLSLLTISVDEGHSTNC